MRKLTKTQFDRIDGWMQIHARPLDRAKWNQMFHGGSREDIVAEMLRYQNPDGGFGNGFEPDVLLPASAAIPTAEAIFLARDYALPAGEWYGKMLDYFENTVLDIPKYWEDCPPEAMNYPHAPWWNYAPCTVFNPNPCGVVASAMLEMGSPSQKKLGKKIAADCLSLLLSDDFCGDHDTLNMMALVNVLREGDYPQYDNDVHHAIRRRIRENTCFDRSKWMEYTFQPLDFADAPDSPWYDVVKEGVEENFDFWLDSLNDEGVWEPNFSWGVDSDIAREVRRQWKGHIACKRTRILRNFGRISLV